MGIKSLSLSLALLAALILSLTPLVLSQCGTNWMGDTSGDTDFYVSRNQNLGTGLASDASASSAYAPAVALGSAARANANATISSVKVSLPSPQSPGSSITWMAEASNPKSEPMLYDFLLSGPSTGGEFRDMTGWSEESTWTWNTSKADEGDNMVQVLVTRQGSVAWEDSETIPYYIGAVSNGSSDSAVSPTAPAGTGPSPQMDILGANMRVPDTKPIPLAQPGEAVAAEAPQESGPKEPEILDVAGKWTVKLEEAGISLNPLTLIQTGERLMGSGVFNEDGSKLQVTATGSVSQDAVSLHIWTVVAEYGNQIDKSVDLDLVRVDRTISGSYQLYSGEETVGSGNATASRAAA
ncbi:MAG: hypothetical protein GX463_09730 [Methanothrix sp.]|nr:hypothetical protein [Methanothrix sp.]